MIFIVKYSVMQNVWLWSSAILHIQNTVKTKAYKNDKANQGEGIHNILPSSALFLFLRWPSGQTSLTVAPNFLLSPISQYQNDKPRFSRDTPIIHAPVLNFVPLLALPAFSFVVVSILHHFLSCCMQTRGGMGSVPYVPKLYAFIGLAK